MKINTIRVIIHNLKIINKKKTKKSMCTNAVGLCKRFVYDTYKKNYNSVQFKKENALTRNRPRQALYAIRE